jgi:hypothetical protein
MNGEREQPYRCELVLESPAGRHVELEHEDVSGASRTMRIAGRVDRVDLFRTTTSRALRILDYKSTNPKPGGYEDGTVVQAPLYMRAVELCLGEEVDRARYRSFKRPGAPKNSGELRVGSEVVERALTIAFSIPERVRAGLFEPVMAAKASWRSFHPGIEVTRTRAQRGGGSRFDD